MGRPRRLKAPNLTYHITSRTNGQRMYLKAHRDKKAFVRILQKILVKYGVILYSLTIMTNHFHMLIRIENLADLSQILCEFKVAYAKYYNARYHMSGHFWGNRFRSTIVQDDRHALICLRYIDRNPVRAGLVNHPRFWPHGTFRAYAYGSIPSISAVTFHPAYVALSKKAATRRHMYHNLVVNGGHESEQIKIAVHRGPFFGSEEFGKELNVLFNLS